MISIMKYDVFISYSRKDTKIADNICKALGDARMTYFIDRQGIEGGFEFPAVLANAILESKVILFLASENSYKSKFTNSELTFAFNEKPKNTILPYIIDGSIMPPALRFVFSSINWRTIDSCPIEPTLINDLKKMIDELDGRSDIIQVTNVQNEYDPLFCKIAFDIFDYNEALIGPSLIQRKSGVGYKRAIYVVEKLVEFGVLLKISDFTYKLLIEKKELLEQILEVRGVLKRFKVGDLYNFKDKVGIVFEVDDARTSGKIISLKDTISRYGWYVNSGRICRLKHFDFDDGAENMNKIISQKDWYKQYPAFAVCSDYGPEWYLPALNELKTIYENREILSEKCVQNGGNWFSGGWDYWSSTKDNQDQVISLNMRTGMDLCTHNHMKLCHVRAISKF